MVFYKHTLLPLDDCLYALQPSIGYLARSSLHCCLQCHGISRLPQIEEEKPTRKAFKLYLFVAIDRTSKFAFVRLEESATVETAIAFLESLL